MENNFKKNIVISAVNVTNAGPLTILQEVLKFASEHLSLEYTIIALVHNKSLFKIDNITFYEFPDSKRSWLRRLYYEYIYFKKLSEDIKPYLWLSLHDMTPNVKSEIQAVYCHNVSSYYKLSFKDVFIDPKFMLFNLFYRYLYWINIRRNNFIIVQQDWFRSRLSEIYNINKIIVSHPSFSDNHSVKKEGRKFREGKGYIFFYPAFSRFFKNIEVIGNAANILKEKGVNNFEVYLTITGKENRYSKYIYRKYSCVENIKFIGLIPRDKVFDIYDTADCLIFPSKLESWGLPISEFKEYGKPLLVADLEYAHETVGHYDKVKFFNPDKAGELAHLMQVIIENRLTFEQAESKEIKMPFAQDWQQLFNILLKKCTI